MPAVVPYNKAGVQFLDSPRSARRRHSHTWGAMDFLTRGHMLADVPAILGSLDIVFGEIDAN